MDSSPREPAAGPAHPREEFDGSAEVVDLDGWSYIVDDSIYYADGLYPFCEPVLLAPDRHFRSWRNEYVLVFPDTAHPPEDNPSAWGDTLRAGLTLVVRPHGQGAWIVRVDAMLDLRSGRIAFSPDDLTGGLLEQATTKATRILALLTRERTRRDIGLQFTRPVTAYDRNRARTAGERYALVPTHDYVKLTRRGGSGEVEAFIDTRTGLLYRARRGRERGGLMSARRVIHYAPIIETLAATTETTSR